MKWYRVGWKFAELVKDEYQVVAMGSEPIYASSEQRAGELMAQRINQRMKHGTVSIRYIKEIQP